MTQKGMMRHLQRGPETLQAPLTPVCAYHTGWAEKLQRESSHAVEKRNQLRCPRLKSATLTVSNSERKQAKISATCDFSKKGSSATSVLYLLFNLSTAATQDSKIPDLCRTSVSTDLRESTVLWTEGYAWGTLTIHFHENQNLKHTLQIQMRIFLHCQHEYFQPMVFRNASKHDYKPEVCWFIWVNKLNLA